MRIAILEDQPDQAALLKSYLDASGHDCHVFAAGQALIKVAERESFDLFMLDWEVPDLSGEDVLRWVRAHLTTPVPVIFVTSRDSETDVVAALSQGADDYMKKPVSRREVQARVQALLRRAYPQQDAGTLEIDQFRLDRSNTAASIGGAAVDLTQKEFELAWFLFQNVGRLLSREHIQEAVWGRRMLASSSRSMDTHLSRLRIKLDLRPETGIVLTPVYNFGYRLEQVSPA